MTNAILNSSISTIDLVSIVKHLVDGSIHKDGGQITKDVSKHEVSTEVIEKDGIVKCNLMLNSHVIEQAYEWHHDVHGGAHVASDGPYLCTEDNSDELCPTDESHDDQLIKTQQKDGISKCAIKSTACTRSVCILDVMVLP